MKLNHISQIAERYRDNSNDVDDVSTMVILIGFHIQKHIQKSDKKIPVAKLGSRFDS